MPAKPAMGGVGKGDVEEAEEEGKGKAEGVGKQLEGARRRGNVVTAGVAVHVVDNAVVSRSTTSACPCTPARHDEWERRSARVADLWTTARDGVSVRCSQSDGRGSEAWDRMVCAGAVATRSGVVE